MLQNKNPYLSVKCIQLQHPCVDLHLFNLLLTMEQEEVRVLKKTKQEHNMCDNNSFLNEHKGFGSLEHHI